MTKYYLYTIILEKQRKGFIMCHFSEFEEAKCFAQDAFDALSNGELLECYYRHGVIGPCGSYSINGNCLNTGNLLWGVSDGFNTISVVKVEFKEHWLDDFIKERENSSYLFDPFKGDIEDEKLAEFVERFDQNVFWAN